MIVSLVGLGLVATAAQAAIVYSGPVHIDIPATGVSLDVVTGAFGPSVGNPSITATGTASLDMQDNGLISGGGAYVGNSNTFFNVYAGQSIWFSGFTSYCNSLVDATIDPNQGWNLNSSNNLVAFRFIDSADNQLHYGWVRISLGSDATSSSARAIVEYAYDDSPGQNVFAGVKSTATWDFASTGLPALVQPMQHALNGFLPILTAGLPIPVDDGADTLRSNGTLRTEIDTLWARGIVPNVYTGQDGNATDKGALATALTVQEASEPIHIFSSLNPQNFWPATATPNPWFTSGTNSFPVYPLATPTGGYNALQPAYQALKTGGITAVAGLWLDYENFPASGDFNQQHLAYPSQYYTDSYAAGNGVFVSSYGSNLLTDTLDNADNPMVRYSYDLQYVLLKNSAFKALTDVFGTGGIFGNFNSYFSSSATQYAPTYESPRPLTYPPEAGIVANPSIYANTAILTWEFVNDNPSNYPLNQSTANAVYWNRMLKAVSTCTANNGAVGRTVPDMSYYVADSAVEPYAGFVMSPAVYKELVRHMWLRGISGMQIFNPPPPYESATKSYTELEYARSVLDEMLSFRTFLVNGAPMTYTVNSPRFTGGVEWSGMSNSTTSPTQWVIRAVSLSGSAGTVASISPQPGLTFTNIPAPTDGATYILNADSSKHRVDSRPASLYLQFENGYQDSSGNNLTAVPGHFPSTIADPATSTSVPTTGANVTSVLNGSYGLYASQTNQHSISLSGPTPSHPNQGNYLQIGNAANVFNAASFTAETFVNIAAGSPDRATILAKGLSASPGAFDWEVQYRTSNQIELRFGLANSTQYFLRSSTGQLLGPGWHHVAFTYDASTGTSSPTVTLYVDHVKWAWGTSTDRVLTGVLPQAMMRNSADEFVVGYFGRGIIATFDEVRFTPEVLDPWQMLTNAALQ
jgi:hypothetical protein